MITNSNCEGCPYENTVYCNLITECPGKKEREKDDKTRND